MIVFLSSILDSQWSNLPFAAGDKPHIMEPLVDLTVKAPEPGILECMVEPGEPPAEIHWYKDSKEIYQSSKYEITVRGNLCSLTINDPVQPDEATYTCEVSNKHGRADTKARLSVTGW